MNISAKTLAVVGAICSVTLLAGASAQTRRAPVKVRAPGASALKLVGAIPLPGVEGRLDHFAFDPRRQMLYISALENRSLEVVDVRKRRHLRSIGGINEPQGALFLPRYNRLLVCSRGDGTLRSFDVRTFHEGAWADLGRNADNIRLDTTTNKLYVGSNGEPGPGSLDSLDLAALLPPGQGGKPFPPRSPADFRLAMPRRADARMSVPLSSHPESFQIDLAHHRIFVNVPDEHVVATIDTRTMRVSARWPVPFKRNFPLAFSASSNRVFVVCRNPPRLLVYRAASGSLLSQQPCVGDADDVYYDGASGRLYLIGGEGKVNIFDARSDMPKLLQTVATAPRARTGIFMPLIRLLAVAAPHTPGQRAEILLYRVSK